MTNQLVLSFARCLLIFFAILALGGCGAAAAPCRVGSAVLKIVPFVGHTAATPTDACAEAIDPAPAKEP